MNAKRAEESTEENFEANRDWFMRLKQRSRLHNKKVQVEVASANVEAAARYPDDIAKIMNTGGYTKQESFSIDEIALYWNMSLRNVIVRRKQCLA